MMSVLLSAGLFCACSNDGDGEDNINGKGNIINGGEGIEPRDEIADMNVLYIQSDNGDAESCKLEQPKCGTFSPDVKYPDYSNNSYREVYPLSLVARIKNSSIFYDYHQPYAYLRIYIESTEMININGLNVGDTFGSSDIRFDVGKYICEVNDAYNSLPAYRAKSGQIQVVNRKTGIDGKRYLTLSLQDIKISNSYGGEWAYTFNATVDYEICEYKPVEPDMEELKTPTDGLVFFMLDALYKNETQGRQTFFGEGSEKQECLIINSIQELREAYKGDWNTLIDIPFNYCTLVIGRTYGEHGGITIGDFDLVDNGDSYQLNLTLNNNVNPNYAYTDAVKDLYFWKLIPKMENKPVVFNRITQDVDIDPLGEETAYTKMRTRWFLDSYIDANGTSHQVANDWGNERYFIEFKENGRAEGRIGENTFSCYYMLPYTPKIEPNYENGYRDDLTYGVINLWGLNVTEANDDDPISQQFMRIFNSTQFKLWSADRLVLRLSENEVFGFMSENLKKAYYGNK